MLRVLSSALVLSFLGSSVVYAQSLQINPFPVERSSALSAKTSQMPMKQNIKTQSGESKAEIRRLELENAELEKQLEQVEAQKRAQANRSEVISLKEKNRQLAAELRALNASKQMRGASQSTNPVGMTPMPDEFVPEVLEVRASDLGLVEPSASYSAPEVVVASAQPAKIDLETATIKVLPYAEEIGTFEARSSYRSARAGESLEDVLRSWSQSEGVGFLWKTTQRYDVLQPVDNAGDYAASVESLLGQYENQGVRPIGKLHTDPVTGTKTLSIMSE